MLIVRVNVFALLIVVFVVVRNAIDTLAGRSYTRRYSAGSSNEEAVDDDDDEDEDAEEMLLLLVATFHGDCMISLVTLCH